MTLLTHSNTLNLWQDIIHEAETVSEIQLEKDLESYLISLLIRYTDKPEITKQIMAMSFLTGMTPSNKQGVLALQSVGDQCLLFSGLFPNMAEKRLVKISYFVNLGRVAYLTLSKDNNDIYGSLSHYFVALMDVLQAIRQYNEEFPNLLPLQAYDLWNEVGSQRALKVLRQYSQATPLQIYPEEENLSRIKIKKSLSAD